MSFKPLFQSVSLTLALLSFVATTTSSFALKQIPPLSGPVIDETRTLNTTEVRELSARLQSYKDIAQIQVWVTPSLEGESIEGVSIRAVEKWKLGTAKEDNGALIIIALGDRQMRIEVGQGLEGSVPDVIAGRIIDYIMAPKFRGGDFYGGLALAAQEIYVRAGGKGTPTELKARKKLKPGWLSLIFNILWIFFILFVFTARLGIWGPMFLFSGGGRHGGWGGGGGWSGGGGGWSGGGGGWSGGGGGFSGGGSSGSW